MSEPVCGVVELVCPDGVWSVFGVLGRKVVVVFGIFVGDGGDGDDFRAEETEEVDFALGLGVGHVDYEFIAF